MNLASVPPVPGAIFVNPETGALTEVGYRFLLAVWARTGSGSGVDAADVATLEALGDVPDVPADTSLLGALLTVEDAPAAVDDVSAAFDASPVVAVPDHGMADAFDDTQPPADDPALVAMLLGDA